LGKRFWDGSNLTFSVDYDRVKCQERVGKNGTKIRLTVWILCAKWWKRKNGKEKKTMLSDEHGRACAWHGPCVHCHFLARPCVCTARAVRTDKTLVFAFFVLFHALLFWIGLCHKNKSFR